MKTSLRILPLLLHCLAALALSADEPAPAPLTSSATLTTDVSGADYASGAIALAVGMTQAASLVAELSASYLGPGWSALEARAGIDDSRPGRFGWRLQGLGRAGPSGARGWGTSAGGTLWLNPWWSGERETSLDLEGGWMSFSLPLEAPSGEAGTHGLSQYWLTVGVNQDVTRDLRVGVYYSGYFYSSSPRLLYRRFDNTELRFTGVGLVVSGLPLDFWYTYVQLWLNDRWLVRATGALTRISGYPSELPSAGLAATLRPSPRWSIGAHLSKYFYPEWTGSGRPSGYSAGVDLESDW